jgi:hypothetical protein
MAACRLTLDIGYWVLVGHFRAWGFVEITHRKRTYRDWAMNLKLKALEEKLKEVDEKIAEINKRLPAHSVKPPIMMQLFELEDERDAIVKQIENLKK